MREKNKGPIYFFITSDHGEELGENGHWGHDQLNLDSPSVPIIFYGVGVDARLSPDSGRSHFIPIMRWERRLPSCWVMKSTTRTRRQELSM